jgi:hypothetical protein
MKRTIGVFLGEAERRVGTLRFDSQGARQNSAFEYDGGWLAAKDRFALDPTLPLFAGTQFHKPSIRDACEQRDSYSGTGRSCRFNLAHPGSRIADDAGATCSVCRRIRTP